MLSLMNLVFLRSVCDDFTNLQLLIFGLMFRAGMSCDYIYFWNDFFFLVETKLWFISSSADCYIILWLTPIVAYFPRFWSCKCAVQKWPPWLHYYQLGRKTYNLEVPAGWCPLSNKAKDEDYGSPQSGESYHQQLIIANVTCKKHWGVTSAEQAASLWCSWRRYRQIAYLFAYLPFFLAKVNNTSFLFCKQFQTTQVAPNVLQQLTTLKP